MIYVIPKTNSRACLKVPKAVLGTSIILPEASCPRIERKNAANYKSWPSQEERYERRSTHSSYKTSDAISFTQNMAKYRNYGDYASLQLEMSKQLQGSTKRQQVFIQMIHSRSHFFLIFS